VAKKTVPKRGRAGTRERKRADSPKRSKIASPVTWVEVDHIGDKGHGVEFTHVALPHTLVAFIDGFGWLHEPGTPATVEILREGATELPPAAMAQVRRKVLSVLRQSGNRWLTKGDVRTWVNG
jgi:hypothetical protein